MIRINVSYVTCVKIFQDDWIIISRGQEDRQGRAGAALSTLQPKLRPKNSSTSGGLSMAVRVSSEPSSIFESGLHSSELWSNQTGL